LQKYRKKKIENLWFVSKTQFLYISSSKELYNVDIKYPDSEFKSIFEITQKKRKNPACMSKKLD